MKPTFEVAVYWGSRGYADSYSYETEEEALKKAQRLFYDGFGQPPLGGEIHIITRTPRVYSENGK
jgi:hypothetical protein